MYAFRREMCDIGILLQGFGITGCLVNFTRTIDRSFNYKEYLVATYIIIDIRGVTVGIYYIGYRCVSIMSAYLKAAYGALILWLKELYGLWSTTFVITTIIYRPFLNLPTSLSLFKIYFMSNEKKTYSLSYNYLTKHTTIGLTRI